MSTGFNEKALFLIEFRFSRANKKAMCNVQRIRKT